MSSSVKALLLISHLGCFFYEIWNSVFSALTLRACDDCTIRYVSLNLISLWQQFFMVRDAQMYSAADGGQRCRVSTMELNDELGLVTHLLTDKTGTLTQNSMRLCGLYAYGRAYGSFGNANEASPGHLQTKFLNFVDGARYSLSNDLGANCQPHSRVALAVTTDAAPVHVARSTALTLLGINMAVNHSLQLQHNKFRCSDVDGGAGDTPVHQEIDALEHTLVGVSQDEKVSLFYYRAQQTNLRNISFI